MRLVKVSASVFVLIGLCGLILLPARSEAQIKKVGTGYLFRMKFVKGRTYSYGMTSKVSMAQAKQPMAVSGPMKIKVLSVEGNTAVLETVAGPMTMNGQVLSQAKTVRLKEDSRGVVKGGTAGVEQLGVTLPAEPKRPGQSWEGKTSMAGMGGAPTSVKAHYRFVGMKNAGGRQLAQIAVSFSTSGQAAGKGSGTIYMLAEDGSMWSTNVNLSMSVNGSPIKVNLVMNRH